MWVRPLGLEDPLEEGMATNSSILPWRLPSTEVPGELQYIGSQRVGHNWSDLVCMHPPFNYDPLNFSQKFGIMMNFPNFCPWNTICFYILTLYSETLLISLTSSLCVEFFGFSMHLIMSFVNKNNDKVYFSNGMSFIFFLPFPWLEPPVQCWLDEVRVNLFLLILCIEDKTLNI